MEVEEGCAGSRVLVESMILGAGVVCVVGMRGFEPKVCITCQTHDS